MEMSAPIVSDILNNALFHSRQCINQTLHQILHVLHVCTMDSLLNYDPDFVVNWIEVRAVRRPQIWTFIGVTMISEIIALLDWMQQMMHKLFGKHIMRKRTQPENLSKPILWYRNVYNQFASDVWKTDNPVHKLTTDKPGHFKY